MVQGTVAWLESRQGNLILDVLTTIAFQGIRALAPGNRKVCVLSHTMGGVQPQDLHSVWEEAGVNLD